MAGRGVTGGGRWHGSCALRCMKQQLQRMVLDAARRDTEALHAGELATLVSAVQMRALEQLTPDQAWAFLSTLLMAPWPAHGLSALRACHGLKRWLPEVEALFGVPQLSDEPEPIDVGLHQLRFVQVTAQQHAPLPVRFAALIHKIGKGGTPREIWPSHYKHEQRAHALLDGLALRFAIPADAMALARLTIDEADRVHRASDVRAGPIAAMLARVQAVAQPERFEQLLQLCACDYAAYADHSVADYPKAARLRRALAAYVATPTDGLDEEAALQARAESIAQALRANAVS